jgi:hypothetical protein
LKISWQSFEFEGFGDLGNDLEEELNLAEVLAFQKYFIVLDPEMSVFSFEA